MSIPWVERQHIIREFCTCPLLIRESDEPGHEGEDELDPADRPNPACPLHGVDRKEAPF